MNRSNWGDHALNTVTAVVTVVALLAAARFGWGELYPKTGKPRQEQVDNWQRFVVGETRLGPSAARATIVVFSDFQCPFCAAFAKTWYAVSARYPSQLQLVFRHLPITELHPKAATAAHAAICSGRQSRFGEMHDALFANQDSIASWPIRRFRDLAGVPDSIAFHACLDDEAIAAVIAADQMAAKELDITGTPSMLINETLIRGNPDAAVVDSLVRRALGN